MHAQDSTPSADPRRILVRGVNWLGDAVMTTPALQRLREHFAQAKIALLTPQKLAELWLNHPSVDEVIPMASSQGPLGVARSIAGLQADLAIVLPNSPRSTLEMWLARIPHRIGYSRPWRNWFLTQAVAPRANRVIMHKRSTREINRLIANRSPVGRPPHDRGPGFTPRAPHSTFPETAHQIHEYLHLVAAVGANPEPLAPRLEITDEEAQRADDSFLSALRAQAADRFPETPVALFGLNPGAEYGPAKRWPTENFAAVVSEVSKRAPNCAWLLLGGVNDARACDEIQRQIPGTLTLNLAGKTSLRELMALLKRCRLLLTNDSGPMHVAAALGTPVVVPFGSTSPALTGPGLPGDPRHALLTAGAPCSPCFRRTCPIDFRCMTGISVQGVVEAVLKTRMTKSEGRNSFE